MSASNYSVKSMTTNNHDNIHHKYCHGLAQVMRHPGSGFAVQLLVIQYGLTLAMQDDFIIYGCSRTLIMLFKS